MPYRSSYAKRPSYGRKRRAPMRGRRVARQSDWASAKQLAMSAYRGVSYLKGLVNSELYKLDFTASGNADTTGAILQLVGLAQGDGDGARTGNSVMVKSISIRNTFARSASNANTSNVVTFMLLQDNQQVTDASPTIATVLENVEPRSFLNSETVGRFTVLHRKIINLDTVGKTSVTFDVTKFWPHGHHVRYNGTTSADLQKGCLYALWLGDQGANPVTYNSYCRLSYHDN